MADSGTVAAEERPLLFIFLLIKKRLEHLVKELLLLDVHVV